MMTTTPNKKPGTVEAVPGQGNAFQNNASAEYMLPADTSLAILREAQAVLAQMASAFDRLQAGMAKAGRP